MGVRRPSASDLSRLLTSGRSLLLAVVLTALFWLTVWLFHPGPLGFAHLRWAEPENDDPRWLAPEWEFARETAIVYTWVNGSEPDYRALRQLHGGPHAVGTSRDRDNDELRFSLRTIEHYMPWHEGPIIFVTPGQVPSWLNTSHPRIRVVDQDSIVPPTAVPTFSSNVIEAWLHRIPGLTERFIHMNDDYFFMRRMHPSDFFTQDGGVRFFFEEYIIQGYEKESQEFKKANSNLWMASVFHTNGVLEGSYGRAQRHFLKHAPFVYYRSAFERMHQKWEAEFQQTLQHKFRDFSDVLTPFLHHNYVINEGSKCCGMSFDIASRDEMKREAAFLGISDNLAENGKNFDNANRYRPKMIAINDGFSSAAAQNQIKDFLHSNFGGLRSSFELDS